MRIKESTLRRLIRETLLSESAITPEDARVKDIRFTVIKRGNKIQIVAVRLNSPAWNGQMKGSSRVGNLVADRRLGSTCSNAWEITASRVYVNGLGPLMYDLMMDVVNPEPLMSDRAEVSPDAKKVWDYYRFQRGDVESLQLDNLDNFLTQKVEDNCSQTSAENWSYTEGDGDWFDSSLSKAYRVKSGGTPTMDALQRLGLVEINEND
jgi:hypothetical protein